MLSNAERYKLFSAYYLITYHNLQAHDIKWREENSNSRHGTFYLSPLPTGDQSSYFVTENDIQANLQIWKDLVSSASLAGFEEDYEALIVKVALIKQIELLMLNPNNITALVALTKIVPRFLISNWVFDAQEFYGKYQPQMLVDISRQEEILEVCKHNLMLSVNLFWRSLTSATAYPMVRMNQTTDQRLIEDRLPQPGSLQNGYYL